MTAATQVSGDLYPPDFEAAHKSGLAKDLPLSVRAANCMSYPVIHGEQPRAPFTIAEVEKMTDVELLRIANFGRGSLNELREVIKQYREVSHYLDLKNVAAALESMRNAVKDIEAAIVVIQRHLKGNST